MKRVWVCGCVFCYCVFFMVLYVHRNRMAYYRWDEVARKCCIVNYCVVPVSYSGSPIVIIVGNSPCSWINNDLRHWEPLLLSSTLLFLNNSLLLLVMCFEHVIQLGEQRVQKNVCFNATIQSSGAVWKSRWPTWAGSPSLIVPTVSVDVKQHWRKRTSGTIQSTWRLSG